MTNAVRQLRAVVSAEPPDVLTRATLWGRRHAVRRHTDRFYPLSELGKTAADGSPLDYEGADVALSRSWLEPDCPWCWRAEFWYFVPRFYLTSCRVHPERHRRLPTLPDPFPMGEDERILSERRAWAPIQHRERIPARYWGAAFETSAATPHLARARAFAEGEEERGDAQALTLAGPTGVGKTWDAICVFRRLAVWHCDPETARYFHVPRLLSALVRPADDDEDDLLEQCVEAELLCLDDLGAGYLKDGGLAEQQLESILVEREAEDRTTVVTTNLTLPLLAERLGDRIASRLAGSWSLWIECLGPDLRSRR